jgi:hypothetical protein
MKWVGGDSQETPASSLGMLGNGSHVPLQTVSLLISCVILLRLSLLMFNTVFIAGA